MLHLQHGFPTVGVCSKCQRHHGCHVLKKQLTWVEFHGQRLPRLFRHRLSDAPANRHGMLLSMYSRLLRPQWRHGNWTDRRPWRPRVRRQACPSFPPSTLLTAAWQTSGAFLMVLAVRM